MKFTVPHALFLLQVAASKQGAGGLAVTNSFGSNVFGVFIGNVAIIIWISNAFLLMLLIYI